MQFQENMWQKDNILYQTWYEAFTEDGHLDIDASIIKIETFMKKRDPDKYEKFLNKIKKLETVRWSYMKWRDPRKKAKLFKLIYYRMRLEDDIWDNDTPNTLNIELKEKILAAHQSWIFLWESLSALLGKKVYALAHEIGMSDMVKNGIDLIRKSIMRDGERVLEYEKNLLAWKTKWQSLVRKTRKELYENFNRLDIDGTIYPTALLFWFRWPEHAVECLRPLWVATRIAYILDDLITSKDKQWNMYDSEPMKWILNIPIEDIEKYHISNQDIEDLAWWIDSFDSLPVSIKKWAYDEVQRMENLLNEHYQLMKKNTFTFEWKEIWKEVNFIQTWINNKIIKRKVLPDGYINSRIKPLIKKFQEVSLEEVI